MRSKAGQTLMRLSMAAGLSWSTMTSSTLAWQFRDLDSRATQAADSNGPLLPTDESFLPPVVQATPHATILPAPTPDRTLPRIINAVPKGANILTTTRADLAPVVAKADADAESKLDAKVATGMTDVTIAPPAVIPSAAKNSSAAKTFGVPKTSGSAKGPAATKELPPLTSPKGPSSDPSAESLVEESEALEPVPVSTNPLLAFGEGKANGLNLPTREIRAARFNDVEAGSTTRTELVENWGDPARESDEGDVQILTYQLPTFQQVDITIKDDVVESLLVHFEAPLDVNHVAEQLNLEDLVPVPIPDEFGEVLGQGYPERGLMFNFTDDVQSLKVSAILLEPISGELFRLRAQHDFAHNYQQDLSDLNEAIRLNDQDAEALWLRAEILDACGRTDDAKHDIDAAVEIRPTNGVFRLSRARLMAKLEKYALAMEEVQAVLDEIELPDEIAARAHCLLGDLKAIGAGADHQAALKHHLKAIDFALKVADERRFAVRRMAKHVLIDAHMSVARDIAMGNFQRQKEVVPKWLLRATELADEFISEDQGDPLLQLHVFRSTLASHGALQENFDAAIASEEAMSISRKMISEASDPMYKVQIERILAETLLHSAKVERGRGQFDSAMKYANNGVALLKNTSEHWQETTHDKYLKGELYFLLGSLYAVQQQDHQEAVQWYTKAQEAMENSDFYSPLYTEREHGEMLVSMGLSFWEVGEQSKAIELTQNGAELMKEAVENGSLPIVAMAIPYGNLSAMHGELGDTKKSEEFSKLVAKVEKLDSSTPR